MEAIISGVELPLSTLSDGERDGAFGSLVGETTLTTFMSKVDARRASSSLAAALFSASAARCTASWRTSARDFR